MQCQVVMEEARKVKVRVPVEVWDLAAAGSERDAAAGPQVPRKDKARVAAEDKEKDEARVVAGDKDEPNVKTRISNPFFGKGTKRCQVEIERDPPEWAP